MHTICSQEYQDAFKQHVNCKHVIVILQLNINIKQKLSPCTYAIPHVEHNSLIHNCPQNESMLIHFY